MLCTHLHVDHVGWNTMEVNGRFVPTFPNARYLFSRADFDYYDAENKANPDRPAQHGAFNDGVLPIVEAGMADMIDGEHAIDDNLLIRPAPGHTPGSVTLEARSKGEQGLFTGDILHHPLQVWHPEWNSRFCVDPPGAAVSRRHVLEHCAEHRALMLPAHFARPHCGYVHHEGEAFRFEDLETQRLPFEGLLVTVVTPRQLYLMKKDTVRPKDRMDAEALRRKFGLPDD